MIAALGAPRGFSDRRPHAARRADRWRLARRRRRTCCSSCSPTSPAASGGRRRRRSPPARIPTATPRRSTCWRRIEKFSGVRPDPEAFIEALDPLQPRLYSISSSPKVDPPAHRAVRRRGALRHQRTAPASASPRRSWPSASRPGDQLKVYVQKAHAFRPAGRSLAADHHDRPRHRHRAVPRVPARAHGDQGARPELAVLRPSAQRLRFLLRGRAGRHEGRGRADPAVARLVARRRARNSTCRTACARSAAISGPGSPTARTSMSAATPSAWPGTSKRALVDDRRRPRRAHDRRGGRLRRRPEEEPAAISRTCIDAARRARSPSLAACPAHGAAGAAAGVSRARRQTRGGCRRRRGRGLESRTAVGGRRRRRRLCRSVHATNCWRWRRKPPRGPIVLHAAAWHAEDFSGAAIAVGGFDDDRRSRTLRRRRARSGRSGQRHRQAGVCDFSFGAIVNRSPLVIGISTDGAAPVFGQAIRAKLEALIPRGFAAGPRRRSAGATACSRPACRSPPGAVLAAVRALALPIPTASRRRRFRPADLRQTRAEARWRRRRLRHAGRRRPGRSRLADAARGAGAAVRRRHPDRRSGRARDPRLRAPRGEEDAGRQDRLRPGLHAGRDQRADAHARPSPASAWCGSRTATR